MLALLIFSSGMEMWMLTGSAMPSKEGHPEDDMYTSKLFFDFSIGSLKHLKLKLIKMRLD